MPSDNLVLIDTSVWIDYFSKRNAAIGSAVDRLLGNGQVATAAIIMAELTQGAGSEKEAATIKDYLRPLEWIESSDQHWAKAGDLSYKMRKGGGAVNLTDCYIACLAEGASASVFSLDRHFSRIAHARGCTLFEAEI